jgi:hypothetical protein
VVVVVGGGAECHTAVARYVQALALTGLQPRLEGGTTRRGWLVPHSTISGDVLPLAFGGVLSSRVANQTMLSCIAYIS